MKLITYLIGILIIANVVVYFWPDELNTGAKLYATKADVKPHFLRLNKEIEDKFYERQKIDKIVTESTFTPPISSDAITANLLQEAASQEGAQVGLVGDCYRLGPFLHAANYELAQAVLLSEDLDFKKTKRVSKESDVYRVYLGPFSDPAVAIDTRTELNSKKIFDHFMRKEPDGNLIVSLGIYSNLEKAAEAVELFSSSLASVRQRSENITLPDSFWLHFTLPSEDPLRAKLERTDWGESSTKVGRFQCVG